LTLNGLLQESGTGELVHGQAGASFLPLTLAASKGSTATSATFATPAKTQPRVQLEVKQPDPKQARLEFTLTVDHAAIPQGPVQYQSGDQAMLTTSFLLDDHVHTPVVVTPKLPWRCSKSELETP